MRKRILTGRLALLCTVCLALAGSLVGCGGGSGTYNPTLIGGGSTPAASFTLATTPPSHVVAPGETTTYTATVTSVNGFSSPVTFSVTGLPAGTTGTFSPTSVTPTANGTVSTLTIVTTGEAAPGSLTGTIQSVGKPTRVVTPEGTYTLTVTATGGGISQRSTLKLTITAIASE